MTNEDLLALLSFEEKLENVEILSQYELDDSATFIIAELKYPKDKMCVAEKMVVSFVYYDGQDWIFTPWDWQSFIPKTPDEIEKIKWRVNDTATEGIIFNGLPYLAPWV